MIRLKTNCNDSCDCETAILATAITNADNPIWDLTPYQGAGMGKPNASWRVWERSGNVEYYRGTIAEDGTLTGLPSQFESSYYYDGYMELQQGCLNPCCTEDYWCDDVAWPS